MCRMGGSNKSVLSSAGSEPPPIIREEEMEPTVDDSDQPMGVVETFS